ncbi:MAG: hypothetical protein M1836_007424 [Candelina mexicana]|nr:MAG: hypothetical protein M1836_007424 [Candelina mexicana]
MIGLVSAASWLTLATLSAAATIPDTSLLSARAPNANVLYVLTNEAQNSVLALKVGADGTLSDGSTTSTGGKGYSAYPPDSYKGHSYQGSLGVLGSFLVAVNTGSNSFSVFSIDENDATKLTQVGQTISSQGEYPVSVAISEKLSKFCIANTGNKGSVACFSLDQQAQKITPTDATPRSISGGFLLHVATPPQDSYRTLSEILFNDDSTALIATIKGDKQNPGVMSVWPVSENGDISTKRTNSTPASTKYLSGAATIPGTNQLLVTDYGTDISGAVIVSRDAKTDTFAVDHTIAIETNNQITHAVYSSSSKSLFVSDELVNHITEIDPKSGKILNDILVGTPTEHKGFSDLTALGGFLYALDAKEEGSIAVLDAKTRKEVQNFGAKGLGRFALGLASWSGIRISID